MRFLECLKSTGKTLHGNSYLWLVVKKVISLSNTKVYVFSDSVLCLGKMNENPQSNHAWEARLTWFKSWSEYRALDTNWWWANGIRVEHLHRIHHIAACPWSPRVRVKVEHTTRRFHWTDYLHVDVQRHLLWIKRQRKRMPVKCSTRFSKCKKIWNRTMVISWSWFREKVVLYQRR